MIYLREIEINSNVLSDPSYISNLPIMKKIIEENTIDISNPVTFFIGENGSGKSTLLEAIAALMGFNIEGGGKNIISKQNVEISDLCKYMKIIKGTKKPRDGFFFRAESFYNLATIIDDLGIEEYYGGESLHCRSRGESFLDVITNRLYGEGVYIFDEPESSLSISRQFVLLREFKQLVEKKSQLIISTHSPVLLSYPKALIYEINDRGLELVEYEETEAYINMKYFINNYKEYLFHLFKDIY